MISSLIIVLEAILSSYLKKDISIIEPLVVVVNEDTQELSILFKEKEHEKR